MSSNSSSSDSSEQPQVERRRAPRAPAEFGLSLSSRSAHGTSSSPTVATLRDLSSGGLCCVLGAPLREMTLVDLQLQLPGLDQPAHVQGAVVRSAKERGVNPPSYEVAVFFTEMQPPVRHAIERYVAARLAR